MKTSTLLLAAVSVCLVPLQITSADDEVNFSRDILPLLSDNCFKCHGPDEANREAGLRLDQHETSQAKLESGNLAIVPGKSGESSLYERISSSDPDLRMPPVDSGKKLTPKQIALFRKWIDSGAEWSRHWAFEPPKKPTVLEAVPGWQVKNPIDAFIHEEVKRAGLKPSARASKETLIRRVTLDLTGLPPTIEEIDVFLADNSDDAFEKVVDRLLASKKYGEHMARFWLDAARYGDTHGLHLDNERSIWPYRDWVIKSFNRNQRFDRFTIEQLAGDLLPDATLEQKVATGFNRCNVTTSEGGSIDEEYYVRYAVDRVETTATVWLGLTAGCAACHDHKFDPLTQKEFYQLFSYYFSLTERAMDGNALLPPPSIKVPTEEQKTLKKTYESDLAAASARVEKILADFNYTDPAPDAPLGELAEGELLWIEDSTPAGARLNGNWKFVEGPDSPVHSGKKSHVYTAENDGITQHFFDGATDKLKITEGTRLFTYVYIDPKNPPETIQLQFNDGSWDHRATWGADKAFLAGANSAKNRVIGSLPEAGKWHRLEVTAEQVGLKPGSELNGWAFTQVKGTIYWDTSGIVTTTMSDEQKKSLWAWEQFRKKVPGSKLPDNIQKALDTAREKRNDNQKKELTRYFLRHVHPDAQKKLAEPFAKQEKLKQDQASLEKLVPSTLIMEDRKQPRQAHVLERGEYTLKRDKVSSAIPEWIAPPVPNAPANRLGLAQWLVQPQHPLTARVTVNRFWQQFFGAGLVKTSEDFGVQGEQPSHPELLDWLAVDFVESGWDVKRFLKQIVMSSTYQQSSRVAAEKLATDPQNRLLARGPRFRLDAEVIRDQALSVSGLLVNRIGGKSVKPYQPAGLWKPVGFGGSNTSVFRQDKGEALYRRSMYTFWKRTVPPPSMATFDAPDRETCAVRRARTNTPLQALVLMNDVQFVEAARRFAERVMTEGGETVEQRVTFAVRTVLNRKPTSTEMQSMRLLFNEVLAEFKASPESARQLLSVGESARNEKLDQNELAAWTMVTHLILNLSETVTKG